MQGVFCPNPLRDGIACQAIQIPRLALVADDIHHDEVIRLGNHAQQIDAQDTPIDHVAETMASFKSLDDIDAVVKSLEKEMNQAAKELEFEKAAELRDQIRNLQKLIVLEV